MNKGIMKVAVAGVLAISVIVGGISVLAAGDNSAKGEQFKGGFRFGFDGDDAGMTTKERGFGFNEAVESGVISQETADRINEYFEKRKEAFKDEADKMPKTSEGRREQRIDIFSELVTEGIVTQAEANALKELIPERAKGFGFGGLNLDTLIEKGIIDWDTADKMQAFMESKADKMKAEMAEITDKMRTEMDKHSEEMKQKREAMKNMTDEERKEFFDSNKKDSERFGLPEGIKNMEEPIDIVAEMVTEGILTQAQADAIKELKPQKPAPPEKPDLL